MRSMFTAGILSAKDTSWMGQAAGTGTGATWGKEVAVAITEGSKAFTTYEQERIAEENRKAEEQRRAAAEAATRTAQIQQATTGMQIASTTKIMGLDKPVFYIGAAVLATAVLGGVFMFMSKK